MTAALRTDQLSVNYGGVQALVDVDLTIEPGQLVGLIGPNGAGKTTLIDALSGFAVASGSVHLGDESLDGLSPHARARRGLARTWQSSMLFDDLTVEENLAVASSAVPWYRAAADVFRGRSGRRAVSREVLAQLGLEPLAAASPLALSQGQRKLVGVARALASSPTVVCLDEPAAGLDTNESQLLGEQLRRLVSPQRAMLLVDHDMGLVLSICDLVVVLDFGRVIFRGLPEAVRSDSGVMHAYLGSTAAESPPSKDPA
jgi:ABC-type branched-subunit amino acid transport system ATPase component